MVKAKFQAYAIITLCVFMGLAFFSCASSPDTAEKGKTGADKSRPLWVDSVTKVYTEDRYKAAVGSGNDRQQAEKEAYAGLIKIFGVSIQVDDKISSSYRDAVKNNVMTGWTMDTTVQNTITSSASMDTLIGVEIKETWFDAPRNTYHAAAVMEIETAKKLYTDIIKANLEIINNLTTMNQAEKNTLEGFSRYQFAATIAEINASHANLLNVLKAPPVAGVKPSLDYRKEAINIANAIPIAVIVSNDRQGRIQSAIAKVLADLNFRSGGTNTRYRVEVKVNISEVQLQNPQGFKYARYEISADLVDTAGGRIILKPFNINGREGHSTLSEAENRAVSSAEKRIAEDYKNELNDYLSQMLPKK